jgi:hypothetical protein
MSAAVSLSAVRELPVWRSLLYVPTNVEKFVDKAHTRGADCIQLDLEDSVPRSACDKGGPMSSCASINRSPWRCAISKRQ